METALNTETPGASHRVKNSVGHLVKYIADRAAGAASTGRGGSARKMAGRKIAAFLLPGLLTLSVCMPADAAALYRYINDKGYQEIGYSIPPHLVPNGYDVIDESGRLVRRVAAQLSEEEYAAKLERERSLDACQKAKERVHRRYESLNDIDLAERQYEKQLEESLRNYQANLEYGRTNLMAQQDQAANLERAGKPIPKKMLEAIDRLQLQIQNLTAQMEAGDRSRARKADEFEEERRVFNLPDCTSEQLAQAN